MKWIANEVQNGRFLFCPNGSHLSQYDDPKHYFLGVIQFLKDVDKGTFKKDKHQLHINEKPRTIYSWFYLLIY